MPGFPIRGGGGARRGGFRGGRGGAGRGRGGKSGKRKRKPNWLQVAEEEQEKLKQRKIEDQRKKEEEEELAMKEEEEESEEETAFESLLGAIGERKRDENDDSDLSGDDDDDDHETDGITDSNELTNSKNAAVEHEDHDKEYADNDETADDADDADETAAGVTDSFLACYQTDLEEAIGDAFRTSPSFTKSTVDCVELGTATRFSSPAFDDALQNVDAILEGVVRKVDDDEASKLVSITSWEKLVKPQLAQRVGELLPKALTVQTGGRRDTLTSLQRELMALCLRLVK